MIFSRIRKFAAPAGRGSVLVIAALLLSSATVRLLTSASSVFAQDAQLPTTPTPASHSKMAEEIADVTKHDQPHTTDDIISDKGEISNLIKALQEREAAVSEREKRLEMRLRALSVADAEIEQRLVTLTETEQALRATLSIADEASENDLVKLTTVYESMKPKDAALLFEQMEPNFSAGFLGRMRPDVAAEIMAGLSPQVAYSISVILAGRNANAPKS